MVITDEDDREEADEIFPVDEDMYYDDEDDVILEDPKPKTIKIITPGSITGGEDFEEFQAKAGKIFTKQKYKEKIDNLYRINKDGSIPEDMKFGAKWAPSSIEIKPEKTTTKQTCQLGDIMNHYPQINGLIGPHRDGAGNVYYINPANSMAISGDEAIASLQSRMPQPQYGQYPQQQYPPGYVPPQPQYAPPPQYPNQPPQYRHYQPPPPNQHTPPPPNGLYHNSRNTGYAAAPVAHGGDKEHSPSDWMLKTEQPPVNIQPQQPPQPMARQQVRVAGDGLFRVTKETIEAIYGKSLGISVAHDPKVNTVVPLADENNKLIKFILNGRHEMNKGDHIRVMDDPRTTTVAQAVSKVSKAPIPKVALPLAVDKKCYDVGTIAEGLLVVNRVSKKNNNIAALVKINRANSIVGIDSEDSIIEDIVGLGDSEDFVGEYLAMRDVLLDNYPAVANYIDHKLTKAANDILVYVIRADFIMDDTLASDYDDVIEALTPSNDVDEFVDELNNICNRIFDFDVSEAAFGSSEAIEVLTDTEESPILLLNTDEINPKIADGVITPELLPEIYEGLSMSMQARIDSGVDNPYLYITNTKGHVLKVMVSAAKTQKMALHSVVAVIQ
jgi:hypothetical protein